MIYRKYLYGTLYVKLNVLNFQRFNSFATRVELQAKCKHVDKILFEQRTIVNNPILELHNNARTHRNILLPSTTAFRDRY